MQTGPLITRHVVSGCGSRLRHFGEVNFEPAKLLTLCASRDRVWADRAQMVAHSTGQGLAVEEIKNRSPADVGSVMFSTTRGEVVL